MAAEERRLRLGVALRMARIDAGYPTQQKAARVLGYREKDLSRWESGVSTPRALILAKLYQLYYPHLDLSIIDTDGDMGRYPYLTLADTG